MHYAKNAPSCIAFLQLFNKGRALYAKQLSGLIFNAFGPFQRFINQTTFHCVKKIFKVQSLGLEHSQIGPGETPGRLRGNCLNSVRIWNAALHNRRVGA